MRCPECHHEIGDEMVFCPHCGREVRASPHRPGYLAPTGPVSMPKRKGRTNTPLLVILIVVIVLLVPVLVAVLYLSVLEFNGDMETPLMVVSRQPVEHGQEFSVVSISKETTWSDLEIMITDGTSSSSWTPSASTLDDGGVQTASLGQVSLGSLVLWCNVTDIEGNGVIDKDDSITVSSGSSSSFSPDTTYQVLFLWEPAAATMGQISFSG